MCLPRFLVEEYSVRPSREAPSQATSTQKLEDDHRSFIVDQVIKADTLVFAFDLNSEPEKACQEDRAQPIFETAPIPYHPTPNPTSPIPCYPTLTLACSPLTHPAANPLPLTIDLSLAIPMPSPTTRPPETTNHHIPKTLVSSQHSMQCLSLFPPPVPLTEPPNCHPIHIPHCQMPPTLPVLHRPLLPSPTLLPLSWPTNPWSLSFPWIGTPQTHPALPLALSLAPPLTHLHLSHYRMPLLPCL